MEDNAIYSQSETSKLCARGCGFFGSRATNDLCSKCYKDYLKEKSNSAVVNEDARVLNHSSAPYLNESSDVAVTVTTTIPLNKKNKNRCLCCNKKVGVLGFGCRCGGTFCGIHRYPEKHECKVDYKSVGRATIAQQNPLVKADKLENRI